MNNKVFVFGSNMAGRHGKGAALFAYNNRGAKRGKGMGREGQSYAIPTKDRDLNVLPLHMITEYVDAFIVYARVHPHETFEVTPIGCGLAGYTASQIAPLFKNAPGNCELPDAFRIILET